MKNLLFIVALAFAGYIAYQRYEKSHDNYIDHGSAPYIAIYGRDSCGYTQGLKKFLDSAGISYDYYRVDNKKSADRLHAKMQDAGISTRHYNLPVVDISGEISVRPDPREVVAEYGNAPL